MQTIAERLKYARDRKGWTQGKLAIVAGVSTGTIGNIESGARQSKGSLPQIAEALGVNHKWLSTGQGSPDDAPAPLTPSALPNALIERALSAIHSIAPINNPDYLSVRRVVIKAQAGHAVQYQDDEGPPIWKHKSWFVIHGYDPAQMIAIHVTGDSMAPNLCAGDEVLVDCTSTAPLDGKPFVVAYGDDVSIKRLAIDSGAWRMSSDHPDKSKYPHKTFDHHAKIIGEVVVRQTSNI